MQMKRMMAAALCLLLACSLLVLPAAAADFGAYTANVVVSYTNPDTGEIDDAAGSSNAALGEGMCISATGKKALVETDRSGNTWVTIRLLLQSNCSDIHFYTRVGYNEYQEIGYIESGYGMDGDDSVDYRMNVWSEDTIFKCTMFVTAMGREVVWYLWPDSSSLESGSGDFNVMIDLNEPAPTEPPTEEPTQPSTEAPAQETVEETTEAAAAATQAPDEPEKKPTDAPSGTEPVETSEAYDPAETTASAETKPQVTKPGETTAPQATKPGATKPGETEAMTTAPADASDPSKNTASAEKEEAKEEKGGFPLWGWATVIILILCAAGGVGFYVYMNKDKRHEK